MNRFPWYRVVDSISNCRDSLVQSGRAKNGRMTPPLIRDGQILECLDDVCGPVIERWVRTNGQWQRVMF